MEIVGVKYCILPSNPVMRYSNDKGFRYRPNTDLFYLTGSKSMHMIAVVHLHGKLIIFIRPKDPHHEFWEGKMLGLEGAKNQFGATEVYTLDQFPHWLQTTIKQPNDILLKTGVDPEIDRLVDSLFSDANISDLSLAPFLDQLRIIKDQHEIGLMRRSQEISVKAHLAAIKATKPALTEQVIEGIYIISFAKDGAILPTHAATVASGENALVLHYRGGKSVLEEGDLLLVDTGCEYEMYTSDIARTWPVSGKFTPSQREVYESVLEIQKECIRMVRPGTAYTDIHKHAITQLSQVLIDLGVLNDPLEVIVEGEFYKRYFPHGIGHWLGIDTHDCPSVNREDTILGPGMILTIEPGLYLHHDENVPHQYKGIGIRIEDNVLVTDSGHEVLSASLPKEIDEIEDLIGTSDHIQIG